MELESRVLLASNCSAWNFTKEDYRHINLTRSITAMACVVVVAIIFLFLLRYRMYRSIFQRLYLYLLVATLTNEIIKCVGIDLQNEDQRIVCDFLAFVTYWVNCMILMYSYSMIIYLLLLVGVNIGENCFSQLLQSKCQRKMVEGLHAILPVLLSFVLAWTPYNTGGEDGSHFHSVAGSFCGRTSRLDQNCTASDQLDVPNLVIYYGLHEVIGVLAFVKCIVFSAVYFRLSGAYKEAKRLLRQTLVLIFFQVVYVLAVSYQFFIRLNYYSPDSDLSSSVVYILLITCALISPLRHLIYPIACLLCFYPLPSTIKAIARKIVASTKCQVCHKQSENSCDSGLGVQEGVTSIKTASVRVSTRVSPNSHTFFDVVHPDEQSESAPLVTDSECCTISTPISHTTTRV